MLADVNTQRAGKEFHRIRAVIRPADMLKIHEQLAAAVRADHMITETGLGGFESPVDGAVHHRRGADFPDNGPAAQVMTRFSARASAAASRLLL